MALLGLFPGGVTLETITFILISTACGQNQRVEKAFRVANRGWNSIEIGFKKSEKKIQNLKVSHNCFRFQCPLGLIAQFFGCASEKQAVSGRLWGLFQGNYVTWPEWGVQSPHRDLL